MARSNLKRRTGTKQPLKRVLIYVEGDTELRYFKKLISYKNERFAKFTVIKENSLSDALEKAKIEAYDFDEDEYIWLIHDVDEVSDEDLRDALSNNKDIDCAITNPCFEVWAYWHYKDLFSAVEEYKKIRDLLVKEKILKHEHRKPDVASLPELYRKDNVRQAISRARKNHKDSIPLNNPSSGLFMFIEKIIDLEKLKD